MNEAETVFTGRWITDRQFAPLEKINVFHRQLDWSNPPEPAPELNNSHILFRRRFRLDRPEGCLLRISADDYYKLYVNGVFAGSGPTAGYDFHYFYNEIDISHLLRPGENLIAVHTYYQGLFNRVWVSGDRQHGLLLELRQGPKLILASDGSFLVRRHSGFSAAGIVGYQTQFMERYDAGAPEVGFERPEFDDSGWEHAVPRLHAGYKMFPQPSKRLVYEEIRPAEVRREGSRIRADFGGIFVGALRFAARGKRGDEIVMRFAQELNPDGSLRYELRANCRYEEFFRLSGGERDILNQFDYKSFRYAELELPEGCSADTDSIRFVARHYPFALKAVCRASDERLRAIWRLCADSLHYGVQEVIMDCMEREKGYYLGDGCYSILTDSLLTGEPGILEKFFDDFLRTAFINPGLMTCASCSFMQEIAEFPLIMFNLLLACCDLSGNRGFVRERYPALAGVLDFYRDRYADADGLLKNLDKWCVVEWPAEMRDGYDVDLTEGKVCTVKHNVINAYYIGAVKSLNRAAAFAGLKPYRDAAPLERAFIDAFYLPERHLFRDSVESDHVSYPGNIFPAYYGILPDREHMGRVLEMIREKRLRKSMFFMTFPILTLLRREGEYALAEELMTDPGAWLNMLAEGATRTFEGWGKEMKWNTSLFHLTLTMAAAFLTDWRPEKALDFRNRDNEFNPQGGKKCF